jgi:hypothetical protein
MARLHLGSFEALLVLVVWALSSSGISFAPFPADTDADIES